MQDQFGALVRELEVKRLQEQHRRVEIRLEAMYQDKLEGRITKEMYDPKAHDIRAQSLELLDRMNEMRRNTPPPVQDAIDLTDLTSRAADLFLMQPTHEKQRFLRVLLNLQPGRTAGSAPSSKIRLKG